MRRYVDVKTRNREATCWEMLRWFESQKYVEEQLAQRHGAAPKNVEGKAREIVSLVVQGREYFEAARQVSLATQPTMQYYGMACLASAITVSVLPGLLLGKGHGIKLDESRGCSDLSTLAVQVNSNKGTLLDLLSAVKYDHYHLRYDQSDPKDAVVRAERPVSLSPRQRVPVAELLATIPGVGGLATDRYADWPYAPTAVKDVVLQQIGTGGNFKVIVNPGRESDQAAWARLDQDSYARFGDVGQTEFAELVSREVPTPDDLPMNSLLQDVEAGGQWYVYDREPYLLMPRLAALLTIGFAFGFLARYRPTQWSELVAGIQSPAVHVIRRLALLVFDEFPMLALRELADTHYALGPSWTQMME